MFGFFPSVDRFISILSFLSLQSSSLNKVVYSGFQALAARTLQQRSVIFLPAAFHQPAMVGRNTTCGLRAGTQFAHDSILFHCIHLDFVKKTQCFFLFSFLKLVLLTTVFLQKYFWLLNLFILSSFHNKKNQQLHNKVFCCQVSANGTHQET